MPIPVTSMSNINISTYDVYQVLCTLDPNKAPGTNSIGPAILRNYVGSLTNPVHYLLTLSLRSQFIPLEWQTHSIIPVFKSGDKSSVTNYRPISLLCIISKVLEKLVYQQVFEFIYASLSCHQFGFIPGHSYLQQLLLHMHKLFSASSNHQDTYVIYLDYCKAFDSVPHNELLLKL